jgi:hypothetical protein
VLQPEPNSTQQVNMGWLAVVLLGQYAVLLTSIYRTAYDTHQDATKSKCCRLSTTT